MRGHTVIRSQKWSKNIFYSYLSKRLRYHRETGIIPCSRMVFPGHKSLYSQPLACQTNPVKTKIRWCSAYCSRTYGTVQAILTNSYARIQWTRLKWATPKWASLFWFCSQNEKIDIWKINVPQVSRPCHTHDDFI